MRNPKYNSETALRALGEKHNYFYTYPSFEYKTVHTKIDVLCPIHGIFSQLFRYHLRGNGCKKCAVLLNASKQRSNTEDFINKAIIRFKDTYDYSKTVYKDNAFTSVIITCKEHGDFSMTPNNHLRGQGCGKCSKRKTGWTRTSWKKSCENKIAKLYVIRCYDETESFYKIGITNKEYISDRFRSTLLPYCYEIIKVISSENDPTYIYDLERSLHQLHSRFSYKPLKEFEGSTECFTELLPIINAETH